MDNPTDKFPSYQNQAWSQVPQQPYQPAQPPYYPPMQQVQQTTVVQTGSRVPHGLHLVLTLLTCGLWLPVWIIDTIVRG